MAQQIKFGESFTFGVVSADEIAILARDALQCASSREALKVISHVKKVLSIFHTEQIALLKTVKSESQTIQTFIESLEE